MHRTCSQSLTKLNPYIVFGKINSDHIKLGHDIKSSWMNVKKKQIALSRLIQGKAQKWLSMEKRLLENTEYHTRVSEAKNYIQQMKNHDSHVKKSEKSTTDNGENADNGENQDTACLMNNILNVGLTVTETDINKVDTWIKKLFHAIRECEVFILAAAYYCNCPIALEDWNKRENILLEWNPALAKECKTKTVQERLDSMNIEADYDKFYADSDKDVKPLLHQDELSQDNVHELKFHRMIHQLDSMTALLHFIEVDLHVVVELCDMVKHHKVLRPFNIEYFENN